LLIEDIITIVIWLILTVVALATGLALILLQRRVTRRRYFERLDEARQRVQEVLDPLYQTPTDPETAVASLGVLRSSVERRALEEALLRHARVPQDGALTRAIVKKLGWIDQWATLLRARAPRPSGSIATMLAELGDDYRPPNLLRRLGLRVSANFVKRCRAADKLGQVPTPEGMWAILVGVTDPHPEVQEICLRYLGQHADPATLPVLIEELIKVLEGRSSQSVRNIKTALVQYSLDDVGAFQIALQHSNRRVRFFATDIIREIADRRAATAVLSKNDFSPGIYRLFTERFHQDEWPDVRARAAVVISHFHDDASTEILRKLLEDEAWFVRMHATRAAATKLYLPLAADVVQRLTDTNWLVREAATKALSQMGELGVDFVLEAFIHSQDRYTNEQICEELQRGGLLITMLENLPADAALDESALMAGRTLTADDQRRWMAAMVVRKMVAAGMVTMLLMLLRGPIRPDIKMVLLRELAGCSSPECLETFQVCAETDPDPQVRGTALAIFQVALGKYTELTLASEPVGN